jgi:hypothetical protein
MKPIKRQPLLGAGQAMRVTWQHALVGVSSADQSVRAMSVRARFALVLACLHARLDASRHPQRSLPCST